MIRMMYRTAGFAHRPALAGLLLSVGVVLAVSGLLRAGPVATPGARLTAGDLTVSMDETGLITGLTAPSGRDYHVNEPPTALLSLIVEDKPTDLPSAGTAAHYRPLRWRFTPGTPQLGETARGTYTFDFAEHLSVTVAFVEKPGYATLAVTALHNPAGKDVRHILWGPLSTSITESVGETVGVVRGRDFAMGLFGTNAKTLGGWARAYPATGLKSLAAGEDTAGDVRTVAQDFATAAAVRTVPGSILQAHTQDYTQGRMVEVAPTGGQEGRRRWVPALTGEFATAGQLVGSQVALFGVAGTDAAGVTHASRREALYAKVLARIGAIEVGEGMPHPQLDKVWAKQALRANAPYLLLEDLDSHNLDTALRWANELGWDTVAKDACWGVFARGGDFPISDAFGGSDNALRSVIERAQSRHTTLGVDIRSNWLPAPYATTHLGGLAAAQHATLAAPVTATATTLTVAPLPGGDLQPGFATTGYVVIGTELMGYTETTPVAENLVLSGLTRGVDATLAQGHAADAPVKRVIRKTQCGEYLAGLTLMRGRVAERLIEVLDLGLGGVSLSGAEALAADGYGALAANLVMDKIYRALAGHDNLITELSVLTPYTWHVNTRAGAVNQDRRILSSGLAAPQVSYPWGAQVSARRNYLARPMLGRWHIPDANGWRWALGKAAALDAGLAYVGRVRDAARHDAPLRREIRHWRYAALAGAFDAPNRLVMQEQGAYFKLDRVSHTGSIGPTWKLSDWAPLGAAGGQRRNSRYLAPQLRGFPTANLARDAEVTVSGALAPEFDGAHALDGFTVTGHDGGAGEWALAAGAREKWIELTWETPRRVREIILFDRASPQQNVRAGSLTLTRADGTTTTQRVDALPLTGGAKRIALSDQALVKARFTLHATQGAAPGLAEFAVLGPAPVYQVSNLATGAVVSGVAAGQGARITDGVIAPGAEPAATLTGAFAQLDLGGLHYIGGLTVWHAFGDGRRYQDVVFELADNPAFTNSTIVFNNDADNSLGLGAGTDAPYTETAAGKQVLFAPTPARYLRLWSQGNTVNDANHLVEVEVYGAGHGTAAATLSASSTAPGDLRAAIDGHPDTAIDLGTGPQYLQLDLGTPRQVNSLVVLREGDLRAYRNVVYQLSNDADFADTVTTVFHNDYDAVHGLGLKEPSQGEYAETPNGHYVRFAPRPARYVRLYSNGSDRDRHNRYHEVLVGTEHATRLPTPTPAWAPAESAPADNTARADNAAQQGAPPGAPIPGPAARGGGGLGARALPTARQTALELSINNVAVTEGATAYFTVTLSKAHTADVTVQAATSDGTATAGSDYTAKTATLTIDAGATSATFAVATTADSIAESSETIKVTLSNSSGGATIKSGAGVGTATLYDGGGGFVNDNDSAVSYENGSNGTGVAWFYGARHGGDFNSYDNDGYVTSRPGAYFEYTFTGTGVDFISETNKDHGEVDLYIDGAKVARVSLNSATRVGKVLAYSVRGLSLGEHTIKGVKVGSGTPSNYLVVDGFFVYAPLDFVTWHLPRELRYMKGEAILAPTRLPRVDGGTGTVTYALTPTLPTGLQWDPKERTISGTPTADKARAQYTMTATDAASRTATYTFHLTVSATDNKPTFGNKTQDDLLLKKEAAMTTVTLPAATDGDGSLTYQLLPLKWTNIGGDYVPQPANTPLDYTGVANLPAGLSFDIDARELSGTPTEKWTRGQYTLVATDADGDTAALSFHLGVVDTLTPATPSSVLKMWTADALTRINDDATGPNSPSTRIDLHAVRNEYESGQVVLRSNADLTITEVAFTDLTSGSNTIAKSHLNYHFAEYHVPVMPTHPNITGEKHRPIYPYFKRRPDPLSNARSIVVPANVTQPIFVKVYVPKGQAAGTYTGTVTVKVNTAQGNDTKTVSLSVKVYAVEIPDAKDSGHLQYNWANTNIYSIENTSDFGFEYYGIAKYSDEWWELMGNMADTMVAHRQNVALLWTVSQLRDGGTKVNADGTYDWNWGLVDEFVDLYHSRGITHFGGGHLARHWKGQPGTYAYGRANGLVLLTRDSVSGETLVDRGDISTSLSNENSHPTSRNWLNAYLAALNTHLKSKTLPGGTKLFDRWYQHVWDEASTSSQWAYLADKIEQHAPGLETIDALARETTFNGLKTAANVGKVKNWVPLLDAVYKEDTKAFFRGQRQAGKKVFAYVVGTIPKAPDELNRELGNHLLAMTMMSWYLNREQLDGYLHWALNAWSYGFHRGDTTITYPDVAGRTLKSSLRYESERGGLEDWELLTLLRDSNDAKADELIAEVLPATGLGYTQDVSLYRSVRTELLGALTGAPGRFTATPGDGQVTLTWADLSDDTITQYQYRQGAGTPVTWGDWAGVPNSSATTTSHTVTKLTNGTAYSFEVRAVRGATPGPASAVVSATPGALPELSINNAAVTEGGTAYFTVTLSKARTANVTVQAATSAGPATAGSDYTAKTATLTIATGSTSATFAVSTTADSIAESSETFKVTLSKPNGGATIKSGAGVGTATLYDGGGSVFVNDNDSAVNYENGGSSSGVKWTDDTGRNTSAFNNYNKDAYVTNRPGAYFEYMFTGTGVDFISESHAGHGEVDIYIDDAKVARVSLYNATRVGKVLAYSVRGLSLGEHTIKGVNVDSGTPSNYLVVDGFFVYAPLDFVTWHLPRELRYMKGEAILAPTRLPRVDGGTGTVTYALTPTLPTGLQWDPKERTISGTPTADKARTQYTMTATDAASRTATYTFHLTVAAADKKPTFGSKTQADLLLKRGTAMSTVTLPEATDGDGTLTYQLLPLKWSNMGYNQGVRENNQPLDYAGVANLPAGVSFNATTRVLSGTPTANWTRALYTLVATDTDGDTAALNFHVAVVTALTPATGSSTLEVWTDDALSHVNRDATKPNSPSTDIDLHAARNEYESGQIVLRSDADLTITEVAFDDLTDGSNTIAKTHLDYRFVEYHVPVMPTRTTQLLYPANNRPDPLSNARSIVVPANVTQPILVTAYVPKGQAAGTYTGTATVKVKTAQGNDTKEVPLSVKVYAVQIPDAKDSEFLQYNWTETNMYSIRNEEDMGRSYYGIDKYSDDWWGLMGNMADTMSKHRQNMTIAWTVALLRDGGTKAKADGTYEWQWGLFDKFIDTYNQRGMTHFGGGHLSLHWTGQPGSYNIQHALQVARLAPDANGETRIAGALVPTSTSNADDERTVARDWLNAYLTALNTHIKAKTLMDGVTTLRSRWFQHLGDEPHKDEHVQQWGYMADTLKVKVPQVRNLDATHDGTAKLLQDAYKPKVTAWSPYLDDFDRRKDLFAQQQQATKPVFVYVMLIPREQEDYNRLFANHLVSTSTLYWYYFRHNVDGNLHWALNVWSIGPDGRSKGDTHIVYPDIGGRTLRSSLRYEAERGGLEDLELLKLYKATSASAANTLAEKLTTTTRTNHNKDVSTYRTVRTELLEAVAPPPVAAVTIAATDTTVTEGDTSATATFTVVLDAGPSADVTVTVTAPTGLELDGPDSATTFTSSEALTFTDSTWSTAQTVTVRAPDDSTDSPSQPELTVTYATTSTDSDYSGLTGDAATVTVTDNDATEVTLAGSAGDVTEGNTKEFTVTLGRGLVNGETLAVPMTFGGDATQGTDYTTACESPLPTGVTCANLDIGNAAVTFTGASGRTTAKTVTLTLTATPDNTAEVGGESVTIGLGTLNARSGTGLNGGASGTDSLADFDIIDPDTTAPTVEITGVPEKINARDPFTVTFTFSEAVTGFAADDISVTNNANKGTFTETSATVYTLTVTPTADADVKVTARANTATDGVNTGPANAVSDTAIWDASVPTVTITGVPAEILNRDPFTVTFTFSEDVTGFAADDVSVTNGDKSAFAGSGASYTLAVTPNANADVTVGVAANAASDGINTGPVSMVAQTAEWDVDVSFSTNAASITEANGAEVSLTVRLTSARAAATVVYIQYQDITATRAGNADYTGSPTSITLPAGDTRATLTIPITNDDATESTETFLVRLLDTQLPTGVTLGSPREVTVTITITDDDAPPAAPGAPTGLTATAGDRQVVLAWTDPSNADITAWEVRQGSGSPLSWGSWTEIASSTATTTTHTVTGLTNGTAYSFELRAKAGTVISAHAARSGAGARAVMGAGHPRRRQPVRAAPGALPALVAAYPQAPQRSST